MTEIEARKWMRKELAYVEPPGMYYGNPTRLAEECANALGEGLEEMLADDVHWIWDIAIEELERAGMLEDPDQMSIQDRRNFT